MRVACVQLRSGIDRAENIKSSLALINQAVDAGGEYILTPEMTNVVDRNAGRVLASLPIGEDLEEVTAYASLARSRKVWLHIGSMAIKISEEKLANRAFLFSPDGAIVVRYDKIHMFDVALENGESWRESRIYQAGSRAEIANIGGLMIGFSICYDLRFAALYRRMAAAGATGLSVPAAFTKQTGEAHWHVLLRARAIECGAFVFAAAQGGRHEDGRDTYGHSLIVSPWGDIMAEMANAEPGVIVADIDQTHAYKARQQIPSLKLENSIKFAKLPK